jgi:hypothetical protein
MPIILALVGTPQLSFPAGDIWSAIEEKQLTDCRR